MVEGGGGGPSFPVVFFDGERESNLGNVNINPTLEYKPFQLMLSQKIGISPNQISIYLVDGRRVPVWPFSEERRRLPITGKVNFAAICTLKDCHFFVVLKRSRKSRNRRERAASGGEIADSGDNEFSAHPMRPIQPDNLVLRRRNFQRPFYDEIASTDLADLNYRLQNLAIQRENYQIAMAKSLSSTNLSSNQSLNPQAFLTMDSTSIVDGSFQIPPSTTTNNNITRRVHCEDCAREARSGNRTTTSFHACFNDPVISNFRTRFGPICRPIKPVR